jgi:hypothetical protein
VLADRGVRKTLIMERSGWVDERMLGVYGHTTPDMQEVAVSAMICLIAWRELLMV